MESVTRDRAAPQGATPGGRPPPYTDSQVRALPGVGVSFWTAGGQRQAVTDANGVVSLGKPGPGVLEVAVNTRSLGGASPNQPAPQQVLIALLLPAVQAVRGPKVVQTTVPSGTDLHVKLGVNSKGEVTSVNFFSGGTFVAAGDINGDGRADLKLFEDLAQRGPAGETRLAIVTPVNDPPTRTTASVSSTGAPVRTPQATAGVGGGPTVWSQSTPLAGVKTRWSDSSGRSVGQAVSDGRGFVSVGSLPQGRYTVSFDAPDGKPATSQLLIGLLLPAVQKVRYVTLPGGKGDVTVDVGPNNEFHTIGWTYTNGGVTHEDTWDSQRLVIPSGGGNARLLFATSSKPDGGAGSSSEAMLKNKAFFEKEGIAVGALVSFADGHAKLGHVGVSARGPGGVIQGQTDEQGTARLGTLPIGLTVLELDGEAITKALRTTGGTGTPAQPAGLRGGFIIPLVAIVAVRTDGQPVAFIGSWPADALPKTIKATLQVGRDGNLMFVNWGKGPQGPQPLTKLGSGTLALGGPNTYTGPTNVNAGTLKALQDRGPLGKPGEVEVNNILMDVSTTR